MPDTAVPAATPVVVEVKSADEMRALGERIGLKLSTGDVLALSGPLGAGKTTLVQGLARGLGVPEGRHVGSPTFALVNQHPGRVALAHADLYRVADETELDELGLGELCDEGVLAVEWADRFPGLLPADHLTIALAITSSGSRTVTLTAHGARAAALLRAA